MSKRETFNFAVGTSSEVETKLLWISLEQKFSSWEKWNWARIKMLQELTKQIRHL